VVVNGEGFELKALKMLRYLGHANPVVLNGERLERLVGDDLYSEQPVCSLYTK
jgi:hypothetical protein